MSRHNLPASIWQSPKIYVIKFDSNFILLLTLKKKLFWEHLQKCFLPHLICKPVSQNICNVSRVSESNESCCRWCNMKKKNMVCEIFIENITFKQLKPLSGQAAPFSFQNKHDKTRKHTLLKFAHLWGGTESWETFTEIKLKREWMRGGRKKDERGPWEQLWENALGVKSRFQ